MRYFYWKIAKIAHRCELCPQFSLASGTWGLCLQTPILRSARGSASGAGTILGQGRQDRERQSREREIKFFAEIGLFLSQKQAFSKRKKKRSSPDLECLLVPKTSVRQIKRKKQGRKNGPGYKSQRGKSLPGRPKYLQGGSCPPTSRAYGLGPQAPVKPSSSYWEILATPLVWIIYATCFHVN